MEKKNYRVTLTCQPITVDVEANDPDDAEYEAIQLLQNHPDIDIIIDETLDVEEI